jgi:pimeloyl-ACP methyl ester carboxylesterase
MNPIAFVGNARALARFSLAGQTEGFPGPVLVIHGSLDTIITPEMARATADAFPRGRLVTVEHVGHSITLEDPALFLKILSDFLNPRGFPSGTCT